MELDTASLEAEILQLSKLSRCQLDDAALELQVDLELYRCDHADLAQYPSDPYDEFLWFARRIADATDGCPEDSALHELTHRQTYLAAAWNYLLIAHALTNAVDPGWSETDLAYVKNSHQNAALRLIDDVNSRPYDLYHCGMRDEPMGEYTRLH